MFFHQVLLSCPNHGGTAIAGKAASFSFEYDKTKTDEKIILPIGALLLSNLTYAQLSTISSNENYIQTKTYLDYNGTTATKSSETVQYFDGLGRPKQVINLQASPLGRDVVTPLNMTRLEDR